MRVSTAKTAACVVGLCCGQTSFLRPNLVFKVVPKVMDEDEETGHALCKTNLVAYIKQQQQQVAAAAAAAAVKQEPGVAAAATGSSKQDVNGSSSSSSRDRVLPVTERGGGDRWLLERCWRHLGGALPCRHDAQAADGGDC